MVNDKLNNWKNLPYNLFLLIDFYFEIFIANGLKSFAHLNDNGLKSVATISAVPKEI